MKQFSAGWTLIRLYTILVYIFMFAPIVVVMVLAFNPKQFGIFPMEGVSLRWFIKLAHNDSIIAAFENSLVLGVALLLFLRWLQQPKSFVLLLIGHVVLTLPYVLLIVQARLVGIKKEYEEAAKSLGANAFQTFRDITFPLLLPAVLAGALFSFTISFDDITATLFWATAQNQTVPVKIFSMLRNSISPEINALGAVMIVLTVATPLLAGYLSRKFSKDKV